MTSRNGRRCCPSIFAMAMALASLFVVEAPRVHAQADPAAPATTDSQTTATQVRIQFEAIQGRQLEVWMNGQPVGLTPIEATLPPGDYLLTASAEGIVPVLERVSLVPGNPYKLVLPVESLTTTNYNIAANRVVRANEAQPNNAHVRLIASMMGSDATDVYTQLGAAERLRPESAMGYLIRSRWTLREEKFEQALELAEKGLAIEPRHAALHRQKARALAQLGRYAAALDAANKAVELDAREWQGYQVRAVIHRAKEDDASARADILAALELSPGNGKLLQELRAIDAAGS